MNRREDVDRTVDQLGLAQAGVKLRVAAVLFTYRCSIACRHCLFGSAPDRPNVVMTARPCADALKLLHETGRVVHIAGGEPMLYWPALADSVRLAQAEGAAPHFIETNCSFATDDGMVRERLGFLKTHGVKGLLASADPYHQEHVPAERFFRVRRIAKDVFGERNFWGPGSNDDTIRDFEAVVRDEGRLREHVRKHPPTMVGTSHRKLSAYLDRFGPRDDRLPNPGWQGPRPGPACRGQIEGETMWEIHIDPYGNIQTNCGIILGRVPETTPARVIAEGTAHTNRFVKAVCEGGAAGLAELAAREHGFVWPETVSQTCELCYLARRFLRKFHPEVFGPEEAYA